MRRLSCAVLGALSLCVGAVAHAQSEVDDAERSVFLVYSGGSAGIGQDAYAFGVHRRLARAALAAGLELQVERVLHGVFHQQGSAVWGVDGTTASTVRFLSAGPPECVVEWEGVGLRTPTEWVLLPEHPDPPMRRLPQTAAAPVVWRRCEAGGVAAHWVGPPDVEGLDWELEAFDVRMAVDYTAMDATRALPVLVLGMPRQEAGRRARAMLELLASRPDAVYVDAGGFVPGASSVMPGQMSLHRPTGFDLLAQLRPAALVPGHTELAPGPRALLDEAATRGLNYVGTNWRSDDPALALPSVIRRRIGEVEVAFLGVIDPTVAAVNVKLEAEGVRLVDPVDAVQEAVDELVLGEVPVDLVVLLAQVPPALQAELRARLYGIDLHLGDPTAATLRVEREVIDARPVARLDRASPLSLPMDGLLTAEVSLGPVGVRRVEVHTVPVTADDPTYAPVSAAVTRVRARVYPGHDGVIVPAPTGVLAQVAPATLDKLVCEAVLDATGADAVFLPALARGVDVPGPLTERMISDRLALLDLLETHQIDGDRMKDFLMRAGGHVPIACGADVGSPSPNVRGRTVDGTRTYRVVTTDRARLTTGLGPLLAGATAGLVLQSPSFRPVVDADGAPRPLAAVAMEGLRAWEARSEGAPWVEDVVARTAATRDPLWVLDVDRLSLRVESVQRTERPDAYSQVPETLINSPNSLTLGGDVDLRLETGGPRVAWEARFRSTYTRLSLTDATPQETADDWRLSSALSLPSAAIRLGGVRRLSPYGELMFDSEYTPLRDSDDVLQPQQADLSLTMGLSTVPWRWLLRLRVGGFVNQDMARLDEKTPEVGGRLEAQTRHDLLRASAVRLETRWEALVFGGTRQDDASDLRFRAWGELRLQLRLIRWLHVAMYAQGLVAQGRVPETRPLVAATTVGAALDLAAAFRLGDYERR